jgi:putative transcriptional regulator
LNLSGRLLVAGPSLGDANFDRTIVYLLEHGPDGALGVVVNRPSEIAVGDALPLWVALVPEPRVIFSGGPVEVTVAVGLARAPAVAECPGWSPIDDTIGSVDLGRDPDSIGAGLEVVRVYVGYSGWAAGQLDAELAGGAWFVVEPEPEDLFTTEPEHLWGQIMRREQRRGLTTSNPSWN